MNKEELLKAIMELPKAETNNHISAMNGINVGDLMSAVDRLNKIPDYNDLLKENKELKKQLEEINKVIEKCGFVNIEQVMLNYCGLLTQQKEFINYLEDEINKLKEQIKNYDIWHEVGTDINFLILKKQFYLEILQKHNEIIGDINDKK